MLKKSLTLLSLSLLLAGCATQLTNLTPQQQVRNANNLYPVEVSFNSRQETIRWQSIQPKIVVGTEFYDMRRTPIMTNRWEGLIPVPQGTSLIHYRYRFEFQYNKMGRAGNDTALSREYTLRILEQ
jgi:PBP1b-binding outer membrane lipoprotein LpoB